MHSWGRVAGAGIVVLGTSHIEREPSSSFSYVCVCKLLSYICVCVVSSLCVGACGAFRCVPLPLSLVVSPRSELQLPALQAPHSTKKRGVGGKRILVVAAALLKRTLQSTPLTWWDRPPWFSDRASSWRGRPRRTCRCIGKPEPDAESPQHCGRRADH